MKGRMLHEGRAGLVVGTFRARLFSTNTDPAVAFSGELAPAVIEGAKLQGDFDFTCGHAWCGFQQLAFVEGPSDPEHPDDETWVATIGDDPFAEDLVMLTVSCTPPDDEALEEE